MRTLNRLFLGLLVIASSLGATTITLNFDSFQDSTLLTTQYSGVSFTNAIILKAGISLNELEFPPHSGTSVVSDDNGPISIAFLKPISSFSGYFTYAEPLTITAYNAADDIVKTITSAFSNNEALSGAPGSSPNEFLQLSSLIGATSLTIAGNPGGGSFVLDDFSYIPNAVITPEPSYMACAGLACLAACVFRTKRLAGNRLD